MNFWFLAKCFLVGISVSSAIGPIFILVFNRGSLHGFWKGFVTALGSALADGCLFLLGSIGILGLIGSSTRAVLIMDSLGGIAMIFFGIRLLRGKHTRDAAVQGSVPLPASLILTTGKAFLVTLLNPLALFFFMFVSMQLVPGGLAGATLKTILLGSGMVVLGSLSILTGVALVAHYIGKSINTQSLNAIAYITGFVLVGIGCYFIFDFIRLWHGYYIPGH